MTKAKNVVATETVGGLEITIVRTRSGNFDIVADGAIVEGGFFSKQRALDAVREYQRNEVAQAERSAGWDPNP